MTERHLAAGALAFSSSNRLPRPTSSHAPMFGAGIGPSACSTAGPRPSRWVLPAAVRRDGASGRARTAGGDHELPGTRGSAIGARSSGRGDPRGAISTRHRDRGRRTRWRHPRWAENSSARFRAAAAVPAGDGFSTSLNSTSAPTWWFRTWLDGAARPCHTFRMRWRFSSHPTGSARSCRRPPKRWTVCPSWRSTRASACRTLVREPAVVHAGRASPRRGALDRRGDARRRPGRARRAVRRRAAGVFRLWGRNAADAR